MQLFLYYCLSFTLVYIIIFPYFFLFNDWYIWYFKLFTQNELPDCLIFRLQLHICECFVNGSLGTSNLITISHPLKNCLAAGNFLAHAVVSLWIGQCYLSKYHPRQNSVSSSVYSNNTWDVTCARWLGMKPSISNWTKTKKHMTKNHSPMSVQMQQKKRENKYICDQKNNYE